MGFEYKVVPAPTRGKKAKGAKTGADRFALALAEVMNTLAAEGWDYLRTDTLPAEERHGLTGRSTVFQNMLVFRRARAEGEVETRDEAAPETANIFVDDSAATYVPKLPAAEKAANIADTGAAPKLDAASRTVAAE